MKVNPITMLANLSKGKKFYFGTSRKLFVSKKDVFTFEGYAGKLMQTFYAKRNGHIYVIRSHNKIQLLSPDVPVQVCIIQ
jgi:hypothetical protein